jgi:uncharacterized iron-regulated membrane protein
MLSENNLQAPQPMSRRLAQFRRWHKWGGLTAGSVLLVLGTTGILLNYKQPVFAALGVPTKRERGVSPLPPPSKPARVQFTTKGIMDGAVNFEQALAIARNQWGDAALERAEIRAERGGVTFRFRRADGDELWVDGANGHHAVKGEYERISRSEADGEPVRSADWGKILIDLHTGRIGGEVGKAIMSVTALLLLLLTLSGVYLWLKPLLIQREYAATKQPSRGPNLQTAPRRRGTRNC